MDDNDEPLIEEDIEPEDEEVIQEETPEETPVIEQTVPSAETKELILDDPYEWDKCQATITITWLPDDGNEQGREMIISGRTHMDMPFIHYFREGELADMPALISVIGDVQQELMGSLEERGKQYQELKADQELKAKQRAETLVRKPVTHISTPQVPQFHPNLFSNVDAMNEMNTSDTALKMLQELVRYSKRDYKMFRKTWKDQPVLELMVVGQIKVEDTNVVITEKGKAVYDRAMAWRPAAKPKEEVKSTKTEAPKQVSMF